MAEFNQSMLISLILVTCNSYSRCCRLPTSCNQLRTSHSSGEMKLRVLCSRCWTVLHALCADGRMRCVAERQLILSLTMWLITVNVCWDSQGSHYLLILKFKDFSRTFKDPQISFSRTNSWWTFTAIFNVYSCDDGTVIRSYNMILLSKCWFRQHTWQTESPCRQESWQQQCSVTNYLHHGEFKDFKDLCNEI